MSFDSDSGGGSSSGGSWGSPIVEIEEDVEIEGNDEDPIDREGGEEEK